MTLAASVKSWRARLTAISANCSIHWRAPAIMVCSLFAGIMISIFHHIFNTLIDGRSAGGATEQQWIRRVETAFAFASKLLLATATTVAYTQYLWYYLQRHTSKISSIDAMFAATSNTFRMMHIKIWRGRPVLGLIALVAWTLPLAAIFTPGTLTVQSQVEIQFADVSVPERHFSDVSFYASTLSVNDSTEYKGMSVETTRNVGRVQLANAILSVPRPDTNVTYESAFHGPALQCSRMNTTSTDLVGQALDGLLHSSYKYHGHEFTDSQMVYFGWVPQSEPSLNEVNTTFFEGLITAGNSASSANLDYVSKDAARIYVYLNTSGLTQDVGDDGQFARVPEATSTPDALIICQLYNASYNVHFDVRTTGEQSISSTTDFVNWQTTKSVVAGNGSSAAVFSGQALMEAFGWTFTQFVYVLPPSNGSATIYGTHALEMNPALLPVQSDIEAKDSADYMMHQMEDFFKNMTLGLRYADLPDHSDNSSMIGVNATSKFFRPNYVYEPEALILAYAISNIVALVCVLVGVFAIYKNGASFTNFFSTIVRVTNHLDLEESIDEKDRAGSDPLPAHLASTVVGLSQQRDQVKQEMPKRDNSWSWNENAVPADPDWQASTLRGMGLSQQFHAR